MEKSEQFKKKKKIEVGSKVIADLHRVVSSMYLVGICLVTNVVVSV